MSTDPKCPKCSSESCYADGHLWMCPECDFEWTEQSSNQAAPVDSKPPESGIRDAYGNALQNGDAVIVVKDLKVKGSSSVVKGGTKVKSIRLVDSTDGHNIACKIEGIGAMNLKSEFVKKA